MSLINDMMTKCAIMNKTRVSDGQGGYTTTWTEGAQIDVAITLDTSTQARIGETQGLTNVYTLTTSRNNALEYHDVIKRISDGKYFRVTSDGADKKTPTTAGLNLAQVSAENWSLTE